MIPLMPEKERRQFVLDWCDGRVFTSMHIEMMGGGAHTMRMVFMPLVLGGLASMSEDDFNQIGLIWEQMSEAGPMAINGMPTFFSCRIMSRMDWDAIVPMIVAEEERRRAFLEPTE